MAKVKVYTTVSCSACNQLKGYLKGRNIEFDEVHVEQNMDEFIALASQTGKQVVPILVYGDTVIAGFNVDEIEDVL